MVTNFGGNVTFTPRLRYSPRSEAELLAILDRHAGGRVRAKGSLHSWSEAVVTDDVLLDLSAFDGVKVAPNGDGSATVTVGAGCTLGALLDEIEPQGFTLPTLGAVTVQTVAGAISTGTHGSGKPSLSHHVAGVRVAAYGPDGKARIHEWSDGDELRAARCALGCAGVLVAVTFRCPPRYDIGERVERRESLADVLAGEAEWPLQQWIYVPHLWSHFVFRRRPGGRRNLWSWIYRAYESAVVDVGFHLIVKALVHAPSSWTRWFYRRLFPLLVWKDRTFVDDNRHALTMHHEYFKHLEMELFVPARHLEGALAITRQVIDVFAGRDAGAAAAPAPFREAGTWDALVAGRGSYTHHYPLFCRRILPDDTLISMTAGAAEPFYSISLFTYRQPRDAYREMADLLARTLLHRYGARPHWGKYHRLAAADLAPLYSRLPEFRAICDGVDPRGVFRNDYVRRALLPAITAPPPEK